MNDALREAATVDENWARKEQQRWRVLKASVAGAIVAMVVGVASFVIGVHNSVDITNVHQDVTRVENPCQRYGGKSPQCKRSFEQAVLTITHAEACAILRKAGLRIVDCKGARLAQEKGRHEERAATKEEGGGAHQPGPSGHQPPGPPQGGHTGNGGSTNPSVPPPTEHPERPSAAPSPPVSESANPGLVESAGPTVGGVVSGVTTPACEVAKHLVPVCP